MKSKQRSIDSDNEKILKSRKNQTDINMKINKKRIEISKAQSELQKEQAKLYYHSLYISKRIQKSENKHTPDKQIPSCKYM